MKKCIIFIILALMASSEAYCWNSIGHAAVAQVAENHLNKQTRKALKKYLKGTDIVEIASYADKFYYQWYRDIGWECSNPKILRRKPSEMDVLPTNLEPWCHSYSVDSLYQVYRHNREGDVYVRNCIMDLDLMIRALKENHADMDPETRFRYIAEIVHLMGDFHCPMHVLYVPKAPTGGAYSIYINGVKYGMHSLWDNSIWGLLNKGWDYYDFAEASDTATDEEIEEITKGDVFDWASANSVSVLPAHIPTRHQEMGPDYPESMRWLLYQQLRNGGYRLAKVLNYIFS